MKEIQGWLATLGLMMAGGSFFALVQSSYAQSSHADFSPRSCPPGRTCSYPQGPASGGRTSPAPGRVVPGQAVPGHGGTTGPVVVRPARPAPQPAPETARPCPPGTIWDARIGRCVSNPRGTPSRGGVTTGPIRSVPVRSGEPDEISATSLVNQALRGLDCSQAAQALRRLSNEVLRLAATASTMPSRGSPSDIPLKEQWRRHIRSPEFWNKVWNKMADVYRSCSRECFDDGLAVGQISATSYCSASVALQGLPGPGYIAQPPLPVCETAIHAGCLKGYQQTATSFEGCGPYTTDTYSGIFAEYQSQDCHL